tara:strand:- start:345 stop:1844 length:1500 start_codon:yes stop_codon:yes gene_type:complete
MIQGASATAIKDYTFTPGVTQFQNTPVVLVATDLQVIYVGASGDELLLTNVTDYTVSDIGTSNSASNVTLTTVGIAKLTAAGSSVTVTCQRVMTATQLIDYIAMDNFPAENTENALDKLTLLLAQATEGVVPQDVRSLQFPASDPDTISPVLPDQAARANNILSFDSNGEPSVTSISSSSIGGMTGPEPQVAGNLAIYDTTTGLLKQNNDLAESLFLQQTLNWLSTTTWDSTQGHIATVTVATGVTTSPTFNITNIKPGKYSLIYIQDSVGGAEPIWGAMISGNPTVRTGANEITTLEFVSDGTKLYAIGSSTFGTVDTTGTVKAFAYNFTSEEAAAGHLHCDGRAVSRTTYANLYTKLGTAYGVGDGSTTFNLPDYRGYFLRGLDTTGVVDLNNGSARTFSSTPQADDTAKNGITATFSGNALGNHSHTVTFKRDNFAIEIPGSSEDAGYGDQQQDGTSDESTSQVSAGTPSGTVTISEPANSETRPVNKVVYYGIKF